jgi:hypothetical protein
MSMKAVAVSTYKYICLMREPRIGILGLPLTYQLLTDMKNKMIACTPQLPHDENSAQAMTMFYCPTHYRDSESQ